MISEFRTSPGTKGTRPLDFPMLFFSDARHITSMSPLFHSSRRCRASSFDVDSWRSCGEDGEWFRRLGGGGFPGTTQDPMFPGLCCRSVQMMRSTQGSQSPASSGSWMATSSSGRVPMTTEDKVIPKITRVQGIAKMNWLVYQLS